MTEMTDEEIAAKMPSNHYRVDDGEYKAGDWVLDTSWDSEFCPVEAYHMLGDRIGVDRVVARPMIDPKGKALTDDGGKPPIANVPYALITEVAEVMEYGHEKYGDYNNYKKGMEITRNLSCALRHIYKFRNGEDLDPESNRNHIAHAAARLGFVLDNLQSGKAIDDR